MIMTLPCLISGLEAKDNAVVGQPSNFLSDEHSTMKGFSLKEIFNREPYLALSILFLCLRIILFVFPTIMPRLKAFWTSYASHLNLQIFGQVMERVLNVIDVKRIWTKLRLYKTRNFHERVRSDRVWASSLASVSLGDSSARWWSQISMFELWTNHVVLVILRVVKSLSDDLLHITP